jgi:hypothetical protein
MQESLHKIARGLDLIRGRMEGATPSNGTHAGTAASESLDTLSREKVRVLLDDGPHILVYGDVNATRTLIFSNGIFSPSTNAIALGKVVSDDKCGTSCYSLP